MRCDHASRLHPMHLLDPEIFDPFSDCLAYLRWQSARIKENELLPVDRAIRKERLQELSGNALRAPMELPRHRERSIAHLDDWSDVQHLGCRVLY